MTEYKTMDDLGDLHGKVVMLRADLNVPMDENFHVTNTARIDRTVPTVKELMEKGAKVVVISHFGRPEGKGDMKNSLSHIVGDLEKALGKKVVFVDDCIGEKVEAAVKAMSSDEVLLLENLRFYSEEKKGDEAFAKQMVAPAEVYVSDTFSTAHRAHASTAGVADYLPAVCGYLIQKEIKVMGGALADPKRPFVAILGGAKVSDKIGDINNLLEKADTIIIGGGMAYTFVKAQGGEIGTSLLEADKMDYALEMIRKAKERGVKLLLPVDTMAGDQFAADCARKVVPTNAIPADWMGLDIGPETIRLFADAV